VHDVTRPVAFEGTAQLDGGSLRGSATGQGRMSDLGIRPIQLAFLQTEDAVKLVLDSVALPANN
jgi:hypothetical protein